MKFKELSKPAPLQANTTNVWVAVVNAEGKVLALFLDKDDAQYYIKDTTCLVRIVEIEP